MEKELRKKECDFRSVEEWVDYHSKNGAIIIVKDNLPIEARYENPVHSVLRANFELKKREMENAINDHLIANL